MAVLIIGSRCGPSVLRGSYCSQYVGPGADSCRKLFASLLFARGDHPTVKVVVTLVAEQPDVLSALWGYTSVEEQFVTLDFAAYLIPARLTCYSRVVTLCNRGSLLLFFDQPYACTLVGRTRKRDNSGETLFQASIRGHTTEGNSRRAE